MTSTPDNTRTSQPEAANSLVISYLSLRTCIGVIGITLPLVLSLGALLADGPGLRSSISSYYYSGMGDVFVGSMCAIGIFLMSYRGYGNDHVASLAAGTFAVGVALCPMGSSATPSAHERLIGNLHYGFAALLFLLLAYFCLRLFTKTDPAKPPTRRKLQRNVVYRICGVIILLAIAFVAAISPLPADAAIWKFNPVFWMESLAIVAFGVSWLVKGEAILKDNEV
ncbi:MAG TPA: DUF998 domain-containing protein [Candidatus Kapabacteria bacterium]|nr:DUF998 domain-containing protein [Candidatus Kapabacteria bacterium]